jgi:DNA mismatch repair ATPase MutS
MSPLAIGAAIRVQDSLVDGRSRFMAEITRLKEIVDLTIARRGAVLFLLDEILGGTNSHDRRIGSEALLTGLVGSGAVGLVTTHDLALGAIAARLPGRADNVHFADRFEDGELSFDYRLRPGIVQTSNALALMRSIGLDV